MACGMHYLYPYAIDQATEWSAAWVWRRPAPPAIPIHVQWSLQPCVTEAVTVCVQVGHRLAFNFTVAFAYYSFFYVSYRGQKKG